MRLVCGWVSSMPQHTACLHFGLPKDCQVLCCSPPWQPVSPQVILMPEAALQRSVVNIMRFVSVHLSSLSRFRASLSVFFKIELKHMELTLWIRLIQCLVTVYISYLIEWGYVISLIALGSCQYGKTQWYQRYCFRWKWRNVWIWRQLQSEQALQNILMRDANLFKSWYMWTVT